MTHMYGCNSHGIRSLALYLPLTTWIRTITWFCLDLLSCILSKCEASLGMLCMGKRHINLYNNNNNNNNKYHNVFNYLSFSECMERLVLHLGVGCVLFCFNSSCMWLTAKTKAFVTYRRQVKRKQPALTKCDTSCSIHSDKLR